MWTLGTGLTGITMGHAARPAEQPAAERGIEVELRRGTVTMKITWPASATADFAAWTRELLRGSECL